MTVFSHFFQNTESLSFKMAKTCQPICNYSIRLSRWLFENTKTPIFCRDRNTLCCGRRRAQVLRSDPRERLVATNNHKIAINDKLVKCKSHKMVTRCDLHAYTMCIFLETEYERFS